MLNTIDITPKNLLFIDGCGALLSAFMLAVVLPQFEYYLKVSPLIAYLLAAVAVLYALYSFACYFFVKNSFKPYLRIIAGLNFFYCFFTIAILALYGQAGSIVGFLYFFIEIVIIAILATIELKTAQN